jgi:hypothetical protein
MESLAAQTDPRWTAIIVDDASTDGSAAYLQQRWPAVQVICNPTNRGFAATCNVGLGAAATPFAALLNNDTYLDPEWLAEGLRPFATSSVAAVACLVLLADPPHLIDTAGDVYSVAGGAQKRAHLESREVADGLDSAVLSACGASAIYRQAALAEVGLLDERLESYYEDVDLGFRLAWAGYRCVFASKSICYHYLSSSYDPRGWRYHFNSARNAEIVWWSHMSRRLRRRYCLAHIAFLLLQSCNKFKQGCLRPYVAGKWAVLRHLPHIRGKRQANAELARVSDRDVEAMLRTDWWRMHVAWRFRRRQAAKADDGQVSGEARA